VPEIKPGAAGGETAGKAFPKVVKDAAKAENPCSTCVYCRIEGTGTQVDHAIPKARLCMKNQVGRLGDCTRGRD